MPDNIKITQEHGGMVADCDLFATRDGRLVKADDPEANSLVAREGMLIPPDLVDSLGIEVTRSGYLKESEGTPVPSQAADEEKPKAAADDSKVLTRDSVKHTTTGKKD